MTTPTYVGDNNPDGVILGVDANHKASVYGVTPVAQRTSTVLHSSLLSASSYVTVGSNMALIFTELSNTLTAFGINKTA